MSVSATEGVTPAGLAGLAPPTTTTASPDKQMFMELLVAQLRYQDPLNPAESGEFLAQSAQFTALEKMQAVADSVGMLLGAQMAFGAGSMVGRQVSYTLPDGTTGTGTVQGVVFGATGPVLDVDGVEVPLANVESVSDVAGWTPPDTTDTETGTGTPTAGTPDPTSPGSPPDTGVPVADDPTPPGTPLA